MLNTANVIDWAFPPMEQTVTQRDALLYALSLGYGRDPMDEEGLRFVYEQDLRIVPSFASVLAHPSGWLRHPDVGVNMLKVVHGEQNIAFHKPIPTDTIVVGQTRVISVADKGEGKGATIFTENVLRDKVTDEALATITRTSFCRADGGCGSAGETPPVPTPVPDRAADITVDIETVPGQALLYRLNGDYNPLHASPSSARKSGFDRPILHGLCTYGVACRAVLQALCDNDPARLAYLGARFTAPVFPGETIQTRIWNEGSESRFECHVVERGVRVLGAGTIRLAG